VEEVTGCWIKLHKEELHKFTLHKILLGWSNQGRWGGRPCSAHVTLKMHAIFWFGSLKERDHLEDLGLDGTIQKRS